ncbi:hypothetical protein [Microbacterium sp.]|nr:hypothetical protein [Microbacterium sp.]
MKIVAPVKDAPDTFGDRTSTLETGPAARAAGHAVLEANKAK